MITADLRLNTPRYASLPQIMKAKRKEVKKVTPADLGIEPKSRTQILTLVEPPARKAGQRVSSVDELVDKLKNEAGKDRNLTVGSELISERSRRIQGETMSILVIAEMRRRATSGTLLRRP